MFNNGYNNSNRNGLNSMSPTSSSTTTTTQTTSSSSSSSAATTNSQTQSLIKAYFKTPEGRYKLHSEKTRPPNLLPYSYAKSISQVTVAQLKDKPSQPALTPSFSTTGVRSAAARLLGGNGGKALSFVGGGGYSKTSNGSSRSSHFGGSNGTHYTNSSSHGGKGFFLVFNVGDTVYISDLNSPDKDSIKSLHFSNSNPVCHAFDSEAKDGHDLLIGLSSGDIYSVSLRQQLQDSGKKLVGAQHYNKEGSVSCSRCTSIAWVPKGNGVFVAAHADGNLYVYEKSNPISRWHICQGSVNSIAYAPDGKYFATVGRDGYLRVFDYSKEQLIFGGKSYYGALLCCAWSPDEKYILTGGEEDLVTVWSMEDRKVVAWGEGHNSWVSGVAFDSYWSPPSSDDTEENIVYRFGSVGQDTKLLLWDLPMDEIVVPLRRSSLGGSPTFSTGSQSSHWDSTCPVGTLQPAPSMRDVPKLSPLVAHCVHSEPLSGLVFTEEAILTASWEGHVKIWKRPSEPESKSNSESLVGSSSKDQSLMGKGYTELSKSKPLAESKSNNSKTLLGASSKDQQSLTSKGGVFNFKEMSKSTRLGYLP
ncbi:probable catabolite repression protein creC isoform X2 [Prunus dulcis]|uniref:probable catabolite repression protein creC isoform X2 n=1 Tax=Prunus dulcis TaxID=3755 RepID=UPI0014829E9D|nr:probable catabolite repression protein creC isoform X2 [Prunus dulcis]